MLPVIFLGVKIMFVSFCSIASPFLDLLEGMLAEEVQENATDEGESGNEEEMDTGGRGYDKLSKVYFWRRLWS